MKRSLWILGAVLVSSTFGWNVLHAEGQKPSVTLKIKYKTKATDGAAEAIGSLKDVGTEIHNQLGNLMAEENYVTSTGPDFMEVNMTGSLREPAPPAKDAKEQLNKAAYQIAKDHPNIKVDYVTVTGLGS